MDRERGILQQRIEIVAIRRGGLQAQEWIRSRQREAVMKPALTKPSTPSTRLRNCVGSARLKAATASVQIASTSIHSSSEPSCAPHTAATR